MKIYLGDNYDKFHPLWGSRLTIQHEGKEVTGIVITEHPNFDVSLVSGEHYYGEVKYYLKTLEPFSVATSAELMLELGKSIDESLDIHNELENITDEKKILK